MRSFRTVLVALLLALGGLVCLPVADEVATAAGRPTVAVSPAYPVRGEAFTVSGRLSAHVARSVQLERHSGSKWVKMVAGKSDSGGRYSFRTSSTATSQTYRVVAPKVKIGKKTYAQETSLNEVVDLLSMSPAEPMVGESVTVSDKLSTAVVRPVTLQRLSGKTWASVASGKTTSSGTFTLTVPHSASGMKVRISAAKVKVGKKTYPAITTDTATIATLVQSGAMSLSADEARSLVSARLTFAPARAGRSVHLEWYDGGQWVDVGEDTMDAAGSAVIDATVDEAGPQSFRGVAEVWNGAPAQVTQTATVTVIQPVDDTVAIATTSRPHGVVGEPYSATIAGTRGTTPYAWDAANLPDGLTLNPNTGVISGTPTDDGDASVTITLTDANGYTDSHVFVLSVGPVLSVATASLGGAVVGEAYTLTLAGAGGTATYTWAATGLPAGLSLDASSGVISGTPIADGFSTVSIAITDAHGTTGTAVFSFTVARRVSVATTSLTDAIVGDAYTMQLVGTGGTAPYTWAAAGLPDGLSLNTSTGAISGTPAAANTSTVSLTVTDAHRATANASLSLTVQPVVGVTTTSLADAIVGEPYSATLAGARGTLPYTWSATGLPAGLSLSTSTGVISGTPTAAGAEDVTVTVTDAANHTSSRTVTLTVTPAISIATITLATGVVGDAYTQTLTGTGGTTPYTWSAIDLPDGLSLDSDTGTISGTPTTEVTATVAITVHDAHNQSSTQSLSLTINQAGAVRVTTDALPDGIVSEAWTATLEAADGSAPYTWSATGLPAGLSLDPTTGVISGAPTSHGTFTPSITATDNDSQTAIAVFTFTVAPRVSVATASLTDAIAGDAYTIQLVGTGGTAPYSWAAAGLPDGLSLNTSTGVISGTATTAGTSTVTITITDAHSATANASLSLTVQPVVGVTTTSLADAFVGESYSATLAGTRGTLPYTWSATGLPTGLTLSTSTGVISGTATAAGAQDVTVTVTDAASHTSSRVLTLTVRPAVGVVTTALIDGSVGSTYSLTLAGTGGTGPYTWSAIGLPDGLSLDSDTGIISGTPTAAGDASVTITVLDAHNKSATRLFTLTVALPPSVTTASLSGAVVGEPYEVTLAGSGGTAPYTWAVTGLPAGLSLDATSGVIAGTPSADGFSTVTITITDVRARTNTAVFSFTVAPRVSVATTGLPDAVVDDAYSMALVGTGGTSPYTWAATDLPDGLSVDPTTGAISGTPSTVGVSNVTMTITDAHNVTASASASLTVLPAVGVATMTLDDAVVDEVYSATLAGARGTLPYTWSATGLPTGLSLDSSSGEISGTPTAAGGSDVTITITDADNRSSSGVLTLTVRPVVSVVTTTLTNGVVGQAYSATLTGTGGTLPYTWSATGLPDGLSLDSASGTISGSPTQDGDANVTITVHDAHHTTNTQTLTLTVRLAGAVLVTTTTLADGIVGEAFTAPLTGSGGTAPYTWAATGLPAGLSLDASSGVISGTPTGYGASQVSITIRDADGDSSTAVLTLVVNPALWVTLEAQQGSLEPGGPTVTLPFTIENRGDTALTLDGTVEVALADSHGAPWAAPVGCDSTAYHAVGTLTNGAGTINPGATQAGVVTLTMDNLASNQDACKGVAVPLHVRVSAS